MPHRAASPTGSEFEVDIASALADADFLSDAGSSGGEGAPPKKAKGRRAPLPDANDILKDLEGSDDDEAFIAAQQAASNRKGNNLKGKTVKKGGGFQAMGLNLNLLKAITKKGFNVPTPIQRKTIPLLMDGLDVVGMARTGSGKTAAFVVPMIEKLKAHSAKIGARALIMSPSRELALQTLKVVRELGRGTDLKSVLLVGGDSLEDQFSFMASNPDIIIATPGRFLHLQVEMELDIKTIQYVVFDEADRLFEMGFAAQLTEILHALPTNRQTLLFSATLPKALTEFAKAGLQEPQLVRLDADSKISQDLESAFFTVKSSEKEGALLHLIKDVIKIPPGYLDSPKKEEEETTGKKRKRAAPANETGSSLSTIVFAATKHHVEYLTRVITLAGYPVSHVYGALDQMARKIQVSRFRSGETKILVVTDVAARGIDIPVLANVINYDFPPQPKIFVHRVGRTARAGRRGWAYSLVRAEDTPYLIDLQLFLGRKLVLAEKGERKVDFNFAQDLVVGGFRRDEVERNVEIVNKFLEEDSDAWAFHGVAAKGERQYQRSRPPASKESVKRAKEVVAQKGFSTVHPLFSDEVGSLEAERAKMLARVSNFRPPETIFEIGQRGLNRSDAAEVMRTRRQKIKINRPQLGPASDSEAEGENGDNDNGNGNGNGKNGADWVDEEEEADAAASEGKALANMDEASDADITATFSAPLPRRKKQKLAPSSFEDSEHFMSYNPSTSLAEDRGYSVVGGASFAEAARIATMDLTTDDVAKSFGEASKAKGMRWDKKAKKYVARANDEDGSRGKKMIIGESGHKIAASFKSGRFDDWRRKQKISRMPRVGEQEDPSASRRIGGGGGGGGGRGGGVMGGRQGGRMFHKNVKAPKAADRARDDYQVRKKRVAEAKEKGWVRGRVKNEIKDVQTIGKERKTKARRVEKSNQPGKKRRKGKM